MKIRGKVLQLDVVNKNYNYVSTEVMYKIIDKLKILHKTKPIREGHGLCMLYQVDSNKWDSSRPSLTDIIGVVYDLSIVKEDDKSFLVAEAEVIDTPTGIHIQKLIEYGWNLKFAVNGVFKDHYVSHNEFYHIEEQPSESCDEERQKAEILKDSVSICIIDDIDVIGLTIVPSDTAKWDTTEYYIENID